MTIDDITSAIERRGYTVRVEERPEYVNFRISRGDAFVNRAYSLNDLATLKMSISDFVNSMLYRLSGTMHLVWCKACHEPLLQYIDQAKALKYLQNSTKPNVVMEVLDKTMVASIVSRLDAGMPVSSKDARFVYGTNGDEAIAKASVYRSAKAGPDSPVLERCSGCGYHLDASGVSEIVD